MPINPGAEPWACDGGAVAVLLVHGFNGFPQLLRPWGEYLAERRLSVRIPRLPGHGTSWREANLTRWEDWYAEVERCVTQLLAEHERVVCGGLGTGATLVLRLAQRRGAELSGIILVNPSIQSEEPRSNVIPVLAGTVPSWPAAPPDVMLAGWEPAWWPSRVPNRALASLKDLWEVVRPAVPSVSLPVLLLTSAEDHVVDPANGDWVASALGSTDLTRVVLSASYHLAPVDCDRDLLMSASADFVDRVVGA